MSGKGKVSNDLVAASCAAVLAVYAVGYWRTRDEARRFETRAQERRSVPTGDSADSGTKPVIIEAATPTPTPLSRPEPPPTITPPMVAVAVPSAKAVAAETSSKVAVAASSPPVASPQPTLASTVEASVAAVAVSSESEPDPADPATPAALPASTGYWRDGTYTGWGTSRHGDIKAQVVIKNGRIVESGIASCETRYPCDVISAIMQQPVDRQSPDVDRVSRATESVDAYYFGLVEALAQAFVQPSAEATTPR